MDQIRAQTAENGPNLGPDLPKWTKFVARTPQKPSKIGQKHSKMARNGPKTLKKGPKLVKTLKKGPKWPKNPQKRAKN